MREFIKIACFLLGTAALLLGISPQGVFSQGGEMGIMQARTIPDELRRPQRGETPRIPFDVVIGDLGRGEAPVDAYRFARNILSALADGNYEAPVLAGFPRTLVQRYIGEIGGIELRSFRIGGGKVEADGEVSFLVRFLGHQYSITGELFIRQREAPAEASPPATGQWLLDDLVLEESMSLSEIRSMNRFIFSPYERFF